MYKGCLTRGRCASDVEVSSNQFDVRDRQTHVGFNEKQTLNNIVLSTILCTYTLQTLFRSSNYIAISLN